MSTPAPPSPICVIVPCYNNSGTLRDIVHRVLQQTTELIVVNDGSTDATPLILESLQEEQPFDVVSYPDNRGKGIALRRGFERARERGYRYAVTLDADGQHFPEELPAFFAAIDQHEGALILGSRNLKAENMPGQNSFANRFSNFWFHLQTLQHVPDTQTGFRAYPLEHLPSLRLMSARYEAELELLVLSAWKGTSLVSIPISVYYPPQEERVSHFRPFWDFFRISVLNTLLCLLALVYGYPRMLLRRCRH